MEIENWNFSPSPLFGQLAFFTFFCGVYSEQRNNGKMTIDCYTWFSMRILCVIDPSELSKYL